MTNRTPLLQTLTTRKSGRGRLRRVFVADLRNGIRIGWNEKRGIYLRDSILTGNVAVEIVLRHLNFRFSGDKW